VGGGGLNLGSGFLYLWSQLCVSGDNGLKLCYVQKIGGVGYFYTVAFTTVQHRKIPHFFPSACCGSETTGICFVRYPDQALQKVVDQIPF
jgi:hypothetical protein